MASRALVASCTLRLLAVAVPITVAPAPVGTVAVEAQRGGLQPGWQQVGWAKGETLPSGIVSVDLSRQRSWGVAAGRLEGRFATLVLRLTGPEQVLADLEVRVDSLRAEVFPRVQLKDSPSTQLPGGVLEVLVPVPVLSPSDRAFDRVMMRTRRSHDEARVLVSHLGFVPVSSGAPAAAPGGPAQDPAGPAAPPAPPPARTKAPKQKATARANGSSAARAKTPPAPPAPPTQPAGPGAVPAPPAATGPTLSATVQIDCSKSRPISAMIYGIAYRPDHDPADGEQWTLGATARRWGGNPSSRYNWKLGNAWNTASDWFFQNVNYTSRVGFSYRDFLRAQQEHGLLTALTLPTIGWVAKDTSSVGFPVSSLGPQQKVAPELREAGNGLTLAGKPIPSPPPLQTSVPAPPEFIREWVSAIKAAGSGRQPVDLYILDNEPALWDSTHRDVHPDPVTYEELLDRTIRYGEAVRQADPEAVIAGPAEWGWTGYLYSAQDAKLGFSLHPDRLTHGNTPLVPWLLRNLRKREKKTGTRILDMLDLHFYPQAKGVGIYTGGGTDKETAALRIRSTRALWDPAYVDESWIAEPIRLIPRMREWVSENAPGLGLVIGEWNFGAENHMSGGLAVAEALGRFGTEGLTAAFYWMFPPRDSPAANAFRAFRNFDGQGGRFLDRSALASSSAPRSVSAFASQSEDGGRVVAVLLNFEPEKLAETRVELRGCLGLRSATLRSFTGGTSFGAPTSQSATATGLPLVLPPYSIDVLELQLERR